MSEFETQDGGGGRGGREKFQEKMVGSGESESGERSLLLKFVFSLSLSLTLVKSMLVRTGR